MLSVLPASSAHVAHEVVTQSEDQVGCEHPDWLLGGLGLATQ